MDSKEKEWYVLRVQAREEEKARELLVQNGLDVKVIYRDVYWKKNGVVEMKRRVLFPGYLFVLSELNAYDFNELFQNIKFKYGKYYKNLKYDQEGTPALTSEEKKLIIHLTGDNDVVEKSTGIIEGDQVIIMDGPLMGLEGNIVHIDRHKRLAKLEMDFLGTTRTITVSLEIVIKR
ncbi:MAG: antiterminator LoaP [Erysipelotrichaceae bacterium]|nr:antiterminator LoaP [Erysipelotrichaceae bacterium]